MSLLYTLLASSSSFLAWRRCRGGIANRIRPLNAIVTPATKNPGVYEFVMSKSIPKNLINFLKYVTLRNNGLVSVNYRQLVDQQKKQHLEIAIAIQRHLLSYLSLVNQPKLQKLDRRKHQFYKK